MKNLHLEKFCSEFFTPFFRELQRIKRITCHHCRTVNSITGHDTHQHNQYHLTNRLLTQRPSTLISRSSGKVGAGEGWGGRTYQSKQSLTGLLGPRRRKGRRRGRKKKNEREEKGTRTDFWERCIPRAILLLWHVIWWPGKRPGYQSVVELIMQHIPILAIRCPQTWPCLANPV